MRLANAVVKMTAGLPRSAYSTKLTLRSRAGKDFGSMTRDSDVSDPTSLSLVRARTSACPIWERRALARYDIPAFIRTR
jgi:hypothetical protein